MYYEELRSSIKSGKIDNLYIFEGPEEFLIEFSIADIKKKLIEDWNEIMNFKSFSELPDVGEASDFLETLPVMSERKLTVFRKCGLFSGNIKNKAQWLKLLSNVGEYNCVIIWEPQLEKGKKPTEIREAVQNKATLVSFPLRTESALKSWVSKIAMSQNKKIDQSAAGYLVFSMERKMRSIRTELDKIISYSKSNVITRADVDAVIVKPIDENVYNLINAIFEGRREICYNILYNLRYLRQDPVNLLALLSDQLILIYHAKLYFLDGYTFRDVCSFLGGGYKAEQCSKKAGKIKVENIEKLISLCYESDKNIKQGKVEAWTCLEMIIAEYKYY